VLEEGGELMLALDEIRNRPEVMEEHGRHDGEARSAIAPSRTKMPSATERPPPSWTSTVAASSSDG